MPGPAPKPRSQRRRQNEPARGEWVDLEPLDGPILPKAERQWAPHVHLLWEAWRQDPVTAQYGPADLAAVYELARVFEKLQPNEQRLRMDGLGLTPKGKRDLRWRQPGDAHREVAKPSRRAAKAKHLRAV